jgi:putative hydrolase of the HAD superfamily
VSAIKAVISDFGGVLTTALLQAFNRVQDDLDVPVEAYGAAMTDSLERDGVHPLFALERGEITEAEFLSRLERGLAATLGRDVALHGFGARLMDGLAPNQELFDHFAALRRDRGLRFALCTNNVREWEPLWRTMLPIDDLFETVVDSAFVGLRKPDPAIYRIVCDRLALAPAQCLFLDDVEVNCTAATELGMTAVLFRDSEQAIAEVREALGRGQLSEPSRSQR